MAQRPGTSQVSSAALRHVGLTVTDLARSARFYREMFGFVEVRFMNESGPFLETVTGIQGVHVTTLKMQAPSGGIVELLQYHNPSSLGRDQHIYLIGCSHFALTVSDIDGQYKHLLAHNVPMLSEPTLSQDGKARVFFCKDPDGILIEVVEELR